jgi:hypothetical protein
MAPTDSELRQSILDEEHLKLLGLGYLVSAILSAGFSLLGLFYGAMGLVFGRAIAEAPATTGQPPPEFLGWFFAVFGVAFFIVMITAATLKFLTYRWLAQRRHRVFCMVVAGFGCLEVPYGTALGVCTFLVLNRRSVENAFDQPASV